MSWVASAPWRFVGWGSVFGCLLGKRSEAEGPTHAPSNARNAKLHPSHGATPRAMQKRRAGTGVPWAGVVVFLAPLLMCLLVFLLANPRLLEPEKWR